MKRLSTGASAQARPSLRRAEEAVEVIGYYLEETSQILLGICVVVYAAWTAAGGISSVFGAVLPILFVACFLWLTPPDMWSSRRMRHACAPRRPTTVGDLIAELEVYDPELPVLVQGGLAGFDPLEIVPEMVILSRRGSPPDWLGKFIDAWHPRLGPKDDSAEKRGAVVLARSRPWS